MCGGLVGDVLGNEVSHMGNLLHGMTKSPGKTLEQFALGAADPLGASFWGSLTGQKFTPMVNQFGGETQAQYEQSKRQGINVGPSMTLGGIADSVSAVLGAYGASGGIGSALGAYGGEAGAGAGAGGFEAGAGGVGSDAAAGGYTTAAADSQAANAALDLPAVTSDDTLASLGATSAPSAGGSSWFDALKGVLGGGGSGGGGMAGKLGATAGNRGWLGAMQVLSSLYGMQQERKLSKQASAQSVSNAGLQAVQRSMAAQGYQGSGNMMAALSKYGADAYGANLQQQQASLGGTLSGLGLLTAGVGNLAGWGSGGTGG